ncbi:MAG: ATP synthase F1 subunit epsilon [Rhodospirillaceae bacterium]
MAETTEFELVSPEKLLVSEPVEMVVVPGTEGDFGALPQHAPMLSTLRPGVISIYKDGAVVKTIFVAGGFAEVTETRCTVLAEEAVDLANESVDAIKARIQTADDLLKEADTAADKAEAEKKMATAQAMLEAKEAAA